MSGAVSPVCDIFRAGHAPEALTSRAWHRTTVRPGTASVRCGLIRGPGLAMPVRMVVRPLTLLAAVLVVDTSRVRPFG
jgi:hypothetical protein